MKTYAVTWTSWEESQTLVFQGPEVTLERWYELVRGALGPAARAAVQESQADEFDSWLCGRHIVEHVEKFLAPHGFELVRPESFVLWSSTIVHGPDDIFVLNPDGTRDVPHQACDELVSHNESVAEKMRGRHGS